MRLADRLARLDTRVVGEASIRRLRAQWWVTAVAALVPLVFGVVTVIAYRQNPASGVGVLIGLTLASLTAGGLRLLERRHGGAA